MTQPCAKARRDAGRGREAPVVYAEVRTRLQRARLVTGVLFMITGVVTWSAGAEEAGPVPLVAAGMLAIDAIIRLRADHNPLWSFLVDAIAISVIVAADGGILVPLSALLAYLLVGTILLVRQPGTIWAIGAAAAAFSVASAGTSLMTAAGAATATVIAVWFQVAILFTAAGTLLLAGADNIRVARQRQQDALEAEQRASEIKTQFVSMVSHELRTPLTNISGFAATLGEAWRTLEPPEIDEFLGIIQTEAEHLGNLVDDVLAIPRLETGKLLVDITDFNLRPLAFRIADLIFPAGGEKDASVQMAGNVVVRADPNRVEQVLRNLLDNARKYGGPRVGIESFPRGDSHVIVVADNGHGVPEQDRERIFEQFEQISQGDSRTQSGVGLGLTVTRRLIEAMGGEIWYEPGFPIGARFCFSLPAGEPAASVSPAADDPIAV
jgi:signal transduction histidine kinase